MMVFLLPGGSYMNEMNNQKKSSLKKALLIALVVMLVLLVGWHLILPLLGIAVVVTAAVWGVVLASVVLMALGILLFYIFSGVGVFVICVLGLIWFIGALVFFPFLFPFLVPLLILLLFIGFARRKES